MHCHTDSTCFIIPPSRWQLYAQADEVQERKGISEDDPLVQRIREDVRRETGVDLDQLLNPSKVGMYSILLPRDTS